MDTVYFCAKIVERVDGGKDFTLSSPKDSPSAAEAQVSKAISADMKKNEVLCSTNLVLASNGTVGLKKYFTHDRDAETPYFIEVNVIQYTDESGKPMYKSYAEFTSEYDAETEFWDDKGNGMNDVQANGVMTIVLNHPGGVEISDFWVQYPDPEPEPEPEPTPTPNVEG